MVYDIENIDTHMLSGSYQHWIVWKTGNVGHSLFYTFVHRKYANGYGLYRQYKTMYMTVELKDKHFDKFKI